MADRYVTPNATGVEFTLQGGAGTSFDTGGVGTFGFRIDDGQGATVLARSTTSIVEEGVGIYVATRDLPALPAGRYVAIWDNGAGVDLADEDTLVVTRTAPGAGMLCTLEQVRAYLDVPTGTTNQDDLIEDLIARASKLIEKTAQREFGLRGTLTRTFRMEDGYLDLNPRELQTATLVTLASPDSPSTAATLVADTDYVLLPEGATEEGTYLAIELGSAYRRHTSAFGFARVEITGVWGMAEVPRDIEQAAVQTVGLWLRRDVQAFTSTYNVDEGRLERPEALPSQVQAVAGNYTRWGV